jgi:uracil phosphoribosyltransferase
MKEALMTRLRNRETGTEEFRLVVDKLGAILAAEVAAFLPRTPVHIQTPVGETDGCLLSTEIVLVPILRSGFALLNPFLRFYPSSQVGMIGVRRDEKTAWPSIYYINVPKITSASHVIVLEPMIATGRSLLASLDCLIANGAEEEKIVLVSLLAAPEGIMHLRKHAPKLNLLIVQQDLNLNENMFIVPGLGDFGDRYFGTERRS